MDEQSPRRSKLEHLKDFLRRFFRRKPKSPEDPYAYSAVPIERNPRGRSGAAVAELPEENSFPIFPPRRQ